MAKPVRKKLNPNSKDFFKQALIAIREAVSKAIADHKKHGRPVVVADAKPKKEK